MELTGRIKLILDTQTFDSGFTKREFVLTTQEQYPQDIKLECIQDKVNILDNLNAGDEVTVRFNIKGREYNGRYFVNLQAWRIEGVSESQPELPPADAPMDTLVPDEGDEDLPF